MTFRILKSLAREPRLEAPASSFRFPDVFNRVSIVGKTGTGKTVAGAWLLSEARFDVQPYVMVDYKRDKLLNQIERAIEIDFDDVPSKPGLYHLKPLPTQNDKMENWLWKVWNAGNIGLFNDEGYMLPDIEAFRTILTTGRAKHIPVITLSQRPVDLPRLTISESEFFQAFHLNDRRDRETVSKFTPEDEIWGNWKKPPRLPEFHSRWYDVGKDFSCVLGPVPDMDKILQRFDDRLKPRRRLI
jgi:hypothetical protein